MNLSLLQNALMRPASRQIRLSQDVSRGGEEARNSLTAKPIDLKTLALSLPVATYTYEC